MTSEDPNNLIPDEYAMYESKKLNKIRIPEDFADFEANWIKRKPIMFWRGSTTGHMINSTNSLTNLLRVQVCLLFQDHSRFDLKISKIVANCNKLTLVNLVIILNL